MDAKNLNPEQFKTLSNGNAKNIFHSNPVGYGVHQ